MKNELVIVLDFGGQYSNVIARRVRECGVYCEVKPYTISPEALLAMEPKGIILSGGANSVYGEGAPSFAKALFEQGIPVLGICYGAQLMAYLTGGRVTGAPKSEFGRAELRITAPDSALFQGIPERFTSWMSHNDYIASPPPGFSVTAFTSTCPCAALEDASRKLYAVQFHPEVDHTEHGTQILDNFLKRVCLCSGDWKMADYVDQTVASLREKIGSKRVLCALSGGVDSTVAAVMVHRAVGSQLTCMFIDHGLLRKGEGDAVEEVCKTQFHMNFVRINAQEFFLDRLRGVTDPEKKRKIIGDCFIRIFESEGKKLGRFDYLVQGTIYPDIIESGGTGAAVIKSHHNVGGLPDVIDFEEIIEPLRRLFKDEVRRAGLELGIPSDLVWRQPFPGPGLAVRVIGEITEEKLRLLREADAIFREEVKAAGLERSLSQYFAVLTNMKSVGVMGDGRTYDYTIALRAVTTSDFMTADFARIPYEVLAKASSRIANEVGNINRVVYDITPKPPATIEWE